MNLSEEKHGDHVNTFCCFQTEYSTKNYCISEKIVLRVSRSLLFALCTDLVLLVYFLQGFQPCITRVLLRVIYSVCLMQIFVLDTDHSCRILKL